MPEPRREADGRTVAVVGLGKIGLPLAVQFARKGWRVIGCDIAQSVVDAVNSGRSHVREEPGLSEGVADEARAGRLTATTDTTAATRESEVVVVIVPVMVDRKHEVDFGAIEAATRSIGAGLRNGTLVIYETTLPVSTTRARLGPLLEAASGLHAGADFHLAFSPERLYAGRIFEDLRRYPKIVGGIDTVSTQRAVEFYRTVLDAEVWPVENAETAEFAKLAETTYRDVNIALANQLATYGAARGVNVAEAFNAANSQPYSHLHRASIGVGGHCIPVYPHFLLSDANGHELELVRIGRQTNDEMARRGLDMLRDALGGLDGRRVLVLGASYRENVKELAFSTAIAVVDLLHKAGAAVLIHDPLFEKGELNALEAEDVDLASDLDVDAVVVQAFHDQFRSLDWSRFRGLRAVLDGRSAVDPDAVRGTGARYLAIGFRDNGAAPANGSP